MKLNKITLNNFFSFGENVEVDLTQYSNLVLVKGELGAGDNSNGAGKSSLFEAVFWCLTGKTVRGVRAGDVVRLGQKSVAVAIEFTHNGVAYSVLRSWSSSKKETVITLNGKEERFHDSKQATNRIFELLSVTPEILSLVAFYGRKFNTFSDLSPKERAEIVDLLAQGQRWETARELAAKEVKALNFEYEKNNELKNVSLNQFIEVEVEIKNLATKKTEIQENLQSAIRLAEEGVAQANKDLLTAQGAVAFSPTPEELAEFKTRIAVAEANKTKAMADITTLMQEAVKVEDAKVAEIRKLVGEVNFAISAENNAIHNIESTATAKRAQKGQTSCSQCGQSLPNPPDNDSLENEALEIETGIATHREKILSLVADEASLTSKIDALITSKNDSVFVFQGKMSAAINPFTVEIEAIKIEEVKLLLLQKDADEKIQQKSNALEVAVGRLNNVKHSQELAAVDATIKVQTERLESITKDLAGYSKTLEATASSTALTKYWAQGFKDLRFSAFSNTIKTLEELLNAFCSQQGLDFDNIEVTSFKQNSKGTTSPEINIYVVRDGQRMGLDALSEGETQRVDLACFFTFSLLIERSIGFAVDFNVLDEPLSGLDYEGRQKVFGIISNISKDKQIFTIDHDANFQDLFTDTVVIAKENGVSGIKL